MVPEHDQAHPAPTSEGTKMRSDHLAGGSAQAAQEFADTSEAAKIRSDGLSTDGPSAADVDDTDEATKIEADGLRGTSVAPPTSTEAEKMESDDLH